MKGLAIFAIILGCTAPVFAAQTAYEALRALGAERGEGILNQVVSVNGENGVPDPETWTIVTADPSARGGIRVFTVREGRVESERTPVNRGGDPLPMDFNQLNLDSSGAFSVAEKEAVKMRLGFDAVDYELHGGERGSSPIWTLSMKDPNGRVATAVHVAADTGAVSRGRSVTQEDYDRDRDFVREDQPPAQRDEDGYAQDRDRGDEGGGFLGRMQNFGSRIERHFKRDGAALERFFTGKTEIDVEE